MPGRPQATMTEPRYFSTSGDGPTPWCWRRNDSGTLRPWPPHTGDGPSLPKAELPAGSWGERLGAVLDWSRSTLAAVHAQVDADPLGAAVRFARATGRCCCCGSARLQSVPERLSSACVGCLGLLAHDTLSGLVARG